MIYKLQEPVQDTEADCLFCKTPGLNNTKNYLLTHNRFNSYMVLIFNHLNKAQFYKLPYRDSPHDKIEILMSFILLNLLKPNEHTEDYHITKPNFLFEIEGEEYVYALEKLVSFEANDKLVKLS